LKEKEHSIMSTISIDVLLERLNWRYATKKFDAARKIPAATWAALEQGLVLSPSSIGLQPWKFVIITDRATRETLQPVAYGQSQILDASHLVVFAVKKDLDAAHVDRHVKRAAKVQNVSEESLEGLRQMSLQTLPRGFEWSARQAYIALGDFLTSAAMLGVDACPMEGFVPEEFDKILGLDQLGYKSVVMAAAGYRAADDSAAGRPKVRFPAEEVLLKVG
jgi:nitroreductase